MAILETLFLVTFIAGSVAVLRGAFHDIWTDVSSWRKIQYCDAYQRQRDPYSGLKAPIRISKRGISLRQQTT